MRLYQNNDDSVWMRVAEGRGGYLLAPTLLQLLRYVRGLPVENGVIACTVNRGAISFLPDSAVIETSCSIVDERFVATAAPPLHPHIRGLMANIAAYEELTVEAAMSGDRRVAMAALTCHPLIGDAQISRKLLEETLRDNAAFLRAFVAA